MTNLSLDLKTIKTKNVKNFYNYNNKGDKQLFEWNNEQHWTKAIESLGMYNFC